ncbi:Holliday junction branch migration protein RuvA, partial [candidate division WWE3 bacterium]|nr:Holliday junction branch migration protein RuvA [candidate division WWE3 bacterium]
DNIVVDVGGVGYKVYIHAGLINGYRINDIIELDIHTYVREDKINLYGFDEARELNLFQKLIEVSGVGPKSAIQIMNSLPAADIINSIQNASVDSLTKASGIGKKLAYKIIVELQTKLGTHSELRLGDYKMDPELLEALQKLGFLRNEALKMAEGIDSNLSLQDKIKVSLKKGYEKKT